MTCKRILIFLLTLAMAAGLFACGGPDNSDPMFGEWSEQREDGFGTTYHFKGDGKGELRVLDLVNYFSYTYDDSKIYMEIHVDTPPIKRVYDYKIEGNKITLGYTNDSGEYSETVCYKK